LGLKPEPSFAWKWRVLPANAPISDLPNVQGYLAHKKQRFHRTLP